MTNLFGQFGTGSINRRTSIARPDRACPTVPEPKRRVRIVKIHEIAFGVLFPRK